MAAETRQVRSSHRTPSIIVFDTGGSAVKALFNRNCLVEMEFGVSSSLTTKTRSEP
jgi:hypothetical protein